MGNQGAKPVVLKVVSVKLRPDLHSKLLHYKADHGGTIQGWIAQAIEAFLAEQKTSKKKNA